MLECHSSLFFHPVYSRTHCSWTYCTIMTALLSDSKLLNPGDNSLASSLSSRGQHFSSSLPLFFASSFGFYCHTFCLFCHPTDHSISASFVISASSCTILSTICSVDDLMKFSVFKCHLYSFSLCL